MEDGMPMVPQQPWLSGSQNAERHDAWIAGRAATLLSHYFQPDAPAEVQEAAIEDWVNALSEYSQSAIEHACETYLRDQPRRRPTPGEIRQRCVSYADSIRSRTKGELSDDEKRVAEFAVKKEMLPTYADAERTIILGRNISVPKWITTPVDRALFACRHVERIGNEVLDECGIIARRIRAQEPIGEFWLYGVLAEELLRNTDITDEDLHPYRSSAFFTRRDLYGEEAVREWENGRKAFHAEVVEAAE